MTYTLSPESKARLEAAAAHDAAVWRGEAKPEPEPVGVDTETQAFFPELDHVIYLTGVSTQDTRDHDDNRVGYLVTPDSDKLGTQCEFYDYVGADNGCYNEHKPRKDGTTRGFDVDRWLAWLDKLDRSRVLFAALPDVLRWIKVPHATKPGVMVDVPVGDCDATIARGALYVDAVKAMGFPVALVAQDGLRTLDQIPYHVDAIFVGGSDDYKLGPDAANVIREARDRGLWVHMGRVNSAKRMEIANVAGCDSADGTFLKFCRKDEQRAQYERVVKWFDKMSEKPVVVPSYAGAMVNGETI
jgi:hypothetical protein